ncbi:MAG: glycosyltransferase family 2 protein [Deinococcales bacterium]
MTVTVIIPTLNAEHCIAGLLESLQGFDVIVIDSSSEDKTVELAQRWHARVEVIARSEFDHGKTRNLGAKLARGQILVFLTQDVLPAHPSTLKNLVQPIINGEVVLTYARQQAVQTASPLERFFRAFRFPNQSQTRFLEGQQPLSVRDVAFSNAAAAYRRDVFWQLGGFPEGVILGEDVLMAARALKAGYALGYCADALVWHTHDYSLLQHFKRHFDIGVCYSRAGDALGGREATDEGWRFAKAQVAFLIKEKAYSWFPRALLELIAKWLGYKLGFMEEKLPLWIKKRVSLQPAFWQRERGTFDRE